MNSLKRSAVSAVFAAAAALCMTSTAQAVPVSGTTYTYTIDLSKVNTPTGGFGTVTLTQYDGKVGVKVALADGVVFANTGIGPQFGFNLSNSFADALVSLDDATAATFNAYSQGSYNINPLGSFSNALAFRTDLGKTGGTSANIDQDLNFSVIKAGISLDDFTNSGPGTNASGKRKGGQAGGYSFGLDVGYNRLTGAAGTKSHTDTLPPPPPPPKEVPEPFSVALLGLGLGGIALSRRRK